MRILSHPFRLVGGAVATVEQTSDEGNAEQLAVLILTRRGERPLVPTFGIADPAFRGVDASDIHLGVALFGPDVALREVAVSYPHDGVQEVRVTYA